MSAATACLITPPTVTQQIDRIVADHLGVRIDKVIPKASLVNDLGADSLDTVEITIAIEEHFGIVLPDDDLVGIDTVANLHERVQKQLG